MSDADQTYNGWKNYETWAIGLFLDGNYTGEGTYRQVLELAEEADGDAYALAGSLREYVEEEVTPEGEPSGLATDLIGAALSEVDWDELASHKLEEVSEQD